MSLSTSHQTLQGALCVYLVKPVFIGWQFVTFWARIPEFGWLPVPCFIVCLLLYRLGGNVDNQHACHHLFSVSILSIKLQRPDQVVGNCIFFSITSTKTPPSCLLPFPLTSLVLYFNLFLPPFLPAGGTLTGKLASGQLTPSIYLLSHHVYHHDESHDTPQ